MTAKAQTIRQIPKRRNKHKKAGTIAIPFLITILLSTFLLGGTATYFYRLLTKDTRELAVMPTATASISEEDINEILFVMTPKDDIRELVVMLLHFDPVRKIEYCIGIPNNLEVEHNDKKMTVEQCAATYGASVLRDAVGEALDQPIDRYISMDSDGFQKITSIFGNAAVIVTVHDYGISPADTAQNLDSTQLETLLTSNKFFNESERTAIIGIAVSSLINQSTSERIAANLDGYFNAVVNACTTDITAMDFSDHRHAIQYVFEHCQAPAKTLSIVGEEDADGVFHLSEDFTDALKTAFSQKSSSK